MSFTRFVAASVGSLLLTACGGSGSPVLSPGDPTTFSQPASEWALDIGGTGTAYGVSTTVLGGGNVLLVGGHDRDLVLGRGSPTETTIPGTGVWSLFAGCYGADGSLLWTRSAQASEYVAPYATVALSDGGFVVTGFFAGVASFADGQGSSTQATSIGEEAAFLVCFDARGMLRWFRQFGAKDGFAEAIALTTLADGGVAVTGLYSGHLTVGVGEPAETSMASSELDTFVARFTSGGALVWARSTETVAGYTTSWAITSAADQGVIVGGEVNGTSTFGQGEPAETTIDSVPGTDDTWVARFAPADGALEWVRRIGGPGEDQVYGIAVCADGMIHVAGYFRDSTEVDPDGAAPIALASAGGLDIYVAAFDPAGTPQWARAYGGPGDDYATSATGLPDGSLFLTGVCHEAVDFDGAGPLAATTLPIEGDTQGNIFAVRLDCAGNAIWARMAGGSGDDVGTGVCVDPRTNAAYLTGSFADMACFFSTDPSHQLQACGQTDAFLVRLTMDGSQ